MKYFYTLLVVLFAALSATAQTNMTIRLLDGSTYTFAAEQVDEVTVNSVTLSNQFYYNTSVAPIRKATETVESYTVPTHGTLYGFGTEADAMENGLVVWISDALNGKKIDLLGTTDADVRFYLNGNPLAGSRCGTLYIYKDKFGATLIASASASVGGVPLYLNFRGTFEKKHECTQSYSARVAGGKELEGECATLLRTNGVGTCQLAFGDANATTPEGMHDGNFSVLINISPLSLGKGTLDVQADADAFNVRLYDYNTRRTYYTDNYTKGTLTTINVGSQLYVSLSLVWGNGMRVACDFLGAPTEVEQLETLEPVVEEENVVQIYAADETTLQFDVKAQKLVMKEEGGMYFFYFLTNPGNTLTDTQITPLLKVAPALVNAGEVDLHAAAERTWNVRFKDLQLQSADNAYVCHPLEGTLTCNLNEETQKAEINLRVVNSYPSIWDPTSTAGDGRILRLVYKGTYEKQ